MSKSEKLGTRTVFRLWWAWREAEKMDWLQAMSKKGWHLDRVSFKVFYVFEGGEQANYVYRSDFRPGSRVELAEYLDLCRDAGWQHVASWGGWHYLRIDADAHRHTELYTDRSGLIGKYRRLGAMGAALLAPGYVMLTFLWQQYIDTGRIEDMPSIWIALGLLFGLAIIGTFALLRILLIIRRLRSV